jgi:hypothetical protein
VSLSSARFPRARDLKRRVVPSWASVITTPAASSSHVCNAGPKSLAAPQFLGDDKTLYFTDFYNTTVYRTVASTS